jgi:hypothetical protein
MRREGRGSISIRNCVRLSRGSRNRGRGLVTIDLPVSTRRNRILLSLFGQIAASVADTSIISGTLSGLYKQVHPAYRLLSLMRTAQARQ